MRFLITVVLVLLSTQSGAGVLYSYLGRSFTTIEDSSPVPPGSYASSMSISGFFELAAPLSPNMSGEITADVLDFSFTDGRSTLAQADLMVLGPDDSAFKFFFVETGASGQIEQWNIVLELQRNVDDPDYKGVFFSTENILGGLDPHDVARLEMNDCVGGGCTLVQDRAIATGAGRWPSDPQPPSPVDEPSSTLGLLALGLGCFSLLRSRVGGKLEWDKPFDYKTERSCS